MTDIFDGREATLEGILLAREERMANQNEMLSKYGKPLVSFSMNIPGPVKNSSMIARAFEEGRRMLDEALEDAGVAVLEARIKDEATGCELLYAVSSDDGEKVKSLCVRIEDGSRLGRLFDMDVIIPDMNPGNNAIEDTYKKPNVISNKNQYKNPNGIKLERQVQRKCLICGRPGRQCASRRIHPVSELQEKTGEIIMEYFFRTDGQDGVDGIAAITGIDQDYTVDAVDRRIEKSVDRRAEKSVERKSERSVEKSVERKSERSVAKSVEMRAECISAMVTDALMEEVLTTPKPGLVDRNNNGSHNDMDIDTFMISAESLRDYWKECYLIGYSTSGKAPKETFLQLRDAGLRAEEKMYEATGGVNTHKGAIFLMGTICGALGRLESNKNMRRDTDDVTGVTDAKNDAFDHHSAKGEHDGKYAGKIAAECSRMTREVMSSEYDKVNFSQLGLKGARGEIAEGLPGVIKTSLPIFRKLIEEGADRNMAGVWAFVALVARGTDTNMVRRGGIDAAGVAAEQAGSLLAGIAVSDETANSARIAGNAGADNSAGIANSVDTKDIEELDKTFIEQNLSPGGCADLLAITYFLYDVTEGWLRTALLSQ